MAKRKGGTGFTGTLLLIVLAVLLYYFLTKESAKTPRTPPVSTEDTPPSEKRTKRRPQSSPRRKDTEPDQPITVTSYEYAFEKEKDFGLPSAVAKDCEIVRHLAYTLCYAEPYEQAAWVAYQLTATEVRGAAERENDFRPDPEVSSGSATPEDYRASGYDRGHLAPAADFKFSPEVMSESFFMSNMSPQAPDFNRHIWERLESRVREWVRRDKVFYVVTGPVLKKGLPTIGRRNKVAVPEQYYKIILHLKKPTPKAIAFLMPNEGSEKPLKSFVVSIDEVEQVTGFDFFPHLPDDLEAQLEGSAHTKAWFPR